MKQNVTQRFPIQVRGPGLDFVAAIPKGRELILQELNSEVSVDVPKGIKGILWQKIFTEFSFFNQVIPEEECMIGPVVEVRLTAGTLFRLSLYFWMIERKFEINM